MERRGNIGRFGLLIGIALLAGVGAIATPSGEGAVSSGADLCIPVGKLPPGVKLPGKNNPPGYVRLPPGVKYPGAVQCPKSKKPAAKKRTTPKSTPKPKTGSPTAPAASKSRGCPKGTAAVTVSGKRTCVAARGALPGADHFLMLSSLLGRNVLDGRYDKAAEGALRLPKPIPGDGYGPAQRDVTAIGGTFDRLVGMTRDWPYDAGVRARVASSVGPVGGGAEREMQFTADGPAVTYGTPTTSSSSSGSTTSVTATVSDANGVKGTVTMTGTLPNDRSGNPVPSEATVGFDFGASKNGGSAGFGFSIGLKTFDGLKFDAPCPTAAGEVKAHEDVSVNTHSTIQHTAGYEYLRKLFTIHDVSDWHGSVAPDATLTKISFSDSMVATLRQSWAVLIFQGSFEATFDVTAAGTIDGKSGAVTLDSFTLTGHGSGAGFRMGGFAEAFQGILGEQGVIDKWRKLVSDSAAHNWERFKSAEKEWQEENRCAKLTFKPTSGPSVNPGQTVGVRGTVTSVQDSKPSDSRWETPTFSEGSLAGGLPGSTSAAKPIKFKVKGAGPLPDETTVHMTVRATSRAGIAKDDWYGRVSGWKVTITGPVSSQQSCCWLLSSSISAKVLVRKQTFAGVTAFHGTAPIGYTQPSVTQLPVQTGGCSYSFQSVTGTADVRIDPSSDGKTLKLTLNVHDRTDGTVSCPGVAAPVGGGLADGLYYQYGGNPVLTFPAENLPADQPLNWNVPGPLQTKGALTIHVEHG